MIVHQPEELATYRKDWPKNRGFYCTAQGGEFMKWVDYDGIICFIDADMHLQRLPTEQELKDFTPIKGQFSACLHAYPAIKLKDSGHYMPHEIDPEEFIEVGAALLIAHSDDWKKLRENYLEYFPTVTKTINHHSNRLKFGDGCACNSQ